MAQDANQVDTATIRTQIEQTRNELGRTIDAIQDRLSLRRVVHEAKESFVHATVGRARRLAHQVTDAVNSGQASSNVSAVLDQARSNPAVSALLGSAAAAMIVALATRSRRPRLSKGLGGLAMSLAVMGAARRGAEHRRPAETDPGDPADVIGYETRTVPADLRVSPQSPAGTLLPATD
jgi:hypothetical protein